ncbi:MAG: response regulator [Candidatus Rokubacteria bacterium]|nr:response regulator [Candidatus Rokubacteria bacterium]
MKASSGRADGIEVGGVETTIRVAVVGAARGGEALIRLLGEHPKVEIVALADMDPEALGLGLARERGIPTLSEHRAVFRYTPDVVIEATGKPEVLEDLLRERPAKTEVIGDKSARLLWDFIEAREQTARRLETLLLLSQSLTSTLHLEAVLDLIVEAAISLLEAEAAGLWVIQEDTGEPALRASAGAAEILARSSAMLTWIEELVWEVALGKDGYRRPAMVVPVEVFVGVPLRKEGRILGVLGVLGRMARPFTESDRDLLDSFASQAAIALENARLYDMATGAIETLKESQEKVVQLERLRALGELASGVAHDFNNILAAILGRAQILRSHLEDPVLRHSVEVIERMAWDGARTIQRIQQFTRIRRAQPFSTVAVNELIDDILEATRPRWKDQAEAQGIQYEVVRELGEIPTVAGDPSELREALMNLILNALDAMPQGGTLRIRTASMEGSVTVTVADTGCGMSEKVRRRAFEPFFTTKGTQSTGLGLSVTYGILRRHGGDIAIESQEGQGTTFTIRLPPGKGVAVERESEAPPAAPQRAAILVIDDEEDVRTILAEILMTQGHSVRMAAGGKEGLDFFREEHHDLVLTDLGMPEMSGWQVARAVKDLSPETPVILITGWGEQLDLEALREGSVELVLSKPFRVNEVLTLVVRALERRVAPPR